MNAETFRKLLPDAVREHLPTELHGFRHATRFAFVQFWYGEPAYHFECWAQPRYNAIEIGLHLEHKDGTRNAALHRYFDGYLIEIRDMLGEVWLEQWDKGWHKLYKTIPLEPYSELLLERVSRETARQIIILQPMLRDGLVWMEQERAAQKSLSTRKR